MEIKTKINKWDLIKLKSFFTVKKIMKKMKRLPSEWEKIIANEAADKGLISKIYKQPLQLNARRRQWHPTPVLMPGKSHGRRSVVGYSPWVAKGQTQLSDFTFFHLSKPLHLFWTLFLLLFHLRSSSLDPGGWIWLLKLLFFSIMSYCLN